MKKIKDVIKNWGTFILVCVFVALLLVLFIISECKNDSTFLRIICGILTLCPTGAVLTWLTKRGLDNVREDI